MSRVRLTQRNAADMSIPYPGNVNQPDRKDPSWEQYHTFEQQVNHELPDMRHEWKDNPRDDIGFGVPEGNPPTVASIRVAANKAVRIAVLLLGEKVDDEVVEAQARDLMAMSGDAMDRTLSRFADTQKLYAEEKEEDDKDSKKAKRVWDKDEKKWVEAAEKDDKEDDKKEASAALVKKDDKKAEDKKDEKVEEKPVEVKAEDKKEIPEFIQKKIDESKEKKSAEGDKKEDEKPVEKKAEDKKEDGKDVEKKAEDKADEKEEEKKASVNELNIEMTGAADEEVKPDPEADKQLASVFADDGLTAAENEDKDEEKEAKSKKAGIKKLGGQPKVASASGESVDISSIWESAPDVSQVFK